MYAEESRDSVNVIKEQASLFLGWFFFQNEFVLNPAKCKQMRPSLVWLSSDACNPSPSCVHLANLDTDSEELRTRATIKGHKGRTELCVEMNY